MKRLTAYVSGIVQKVGYRARVIQIANTLGLKGIIENLSDGRVRIIVEGDEDKLRWFEEAIDIKNTLIQVKAIEKDYSQAIGEFSSFSKIVGHGETDSRLDQGIEILKEILVAVKDVNTNLGGKIDKLGDKIDNLGDKTDTIGGKIDKLGDKIDNLGDKIDNLGDKIDTIGGKIDNLGDKTDAIGDKIDNLGGKIDTIGGKMDRMLEKQDATLGKLDDVRADIVGEIREMRRDIKEGDEMARVKSDISQIKAKLGL